MGQLLGQQPRRPSTWRAITRWRDWRISVKLAAVSLVPILIALVLGGITITNQIQRADDYGRMDRLVVLNTDVRGLVDAVQQERTRTVSLLTQGTVGSSPELDAARAATDRAVEPLSADTARAVEVDPGAAAPGAASDAALARLADVRRQVSSGQLGAVQALDAYTAMTGALLTLDTSLVAGMGDASISGTANALHDLQVAKEEVSTSQVLIGYGIARRGLSSAQLSTVRTAEVRLADKLEDFRAAATGGQRQDFDQTVTGQDFDTRARLANAVLTAQAPNASDALTAIPADEWTKASTAVGDSLRAVSGRLGDAEVSTSSDLVDSAGTDAVLLAVALFAALVLTAVVVFLITRQMLRSLRVLRTSALDVADRQLPAAVANIHDGREQSAEVTPLSVGTADEIGQVATAFDAVHSQALRLAIEQAAMRTGFSSVFVNLSRRSQSLVQRQLQLIERLERDEEDADQLAILFQLDHLATRMRRNNENLMVLSGAEPGRRSGQPITTADVLRAAVSEIEQYQRVSVQTPPTARIVGYAASDLMRLIAELLDNATAFSAPETQVTVSTRVGEHRGLVIDIMDQGIGMNESEVAEANARLAEAATVDLATSRRMGLFVVGRLAGRHQIGVHLHGGKDIVGVRATVTVPAELVMGLPETTFPEPPAQQDPDLPHRGVNGAARTGVLTSLAGVTSGTLGDGAAAPGPWAQNGHAGLLAQRPPSDLEVSGTALFEPVEQDEAPPPEDFGWPDEPVRPDDLDRPPADPQPDDLPDGVLPAGRALFEANTGTGGALTEWWSAAAAEPAPPPPPPAPDETTPIFDETLSAWFRSDRPAPKPDAAAEEPADGEQTEPEPEAEAPATSNWDFAADESFRAARAASEAEPTSFTPAGLPRRRRGEHLMPGSAAPSVLGAEPAGEAEPARALPTRDPADVRGRLSSFQQGLSRARHAAEPAEPQEQPVAQPVEAPAPEPHQVVGTTAAGLPQRQRRGRPLPEPQQNVWPDAEQAEAAAENPQPWRANAGEQALPQRQPESPAAQWRPGGEPALPQRQPESPAAQWQSAGESGLPQRQSGGESGLPRRTPGGESGLPQRQPESQAAQWQPAGEQPSGEPQPSDDVQFGGENPLPRRTPGPERATLPHRRPADPPEQQRGEDAGASLWQKPQLFDDQPADAPAPDSALPPRSPGEAEPVATTAESAWSFATDESWRTVQTVSQAAPSGYTAAGLPRRRRGEQLLPGSASSAGAPGPRTQRDPQDVRGRLSSFQQGVRRGRHRTGQPAESEHENMEGE